MVKSIIGRKSLGLVTTVSASARVHRPFSCVGVGGISRIIAQCMLKLSLKPGTVKAFGMKTTRL